ncbi:ribonucleoside-triphosphate reductase, adenosylcobalamin-dependent [Sporolactobacillus terrae]|uniref:ribonucleoside-triphosphate reductase, adenosylcobalamin-dependent n=1 Tax=Sporolactobacillus terrae TaxID=269673 RepID=UPI00111A6595|nr:ribonucleoside-triphosphate reductase, adenosylcobalamin-dependent [Sporolactobacillus terrae]
MQIKLSDAYIQKIKSDVQPHWGELGWVTYKRTYARWIEPFGRYEEWDETVRRVVEGNINLDPRLHTDPVSEATVHELGKEAERLFKLIYSLASTPSGRNLWISGTDYQQRVGDALNNCWFIAIRPQAYGDSHIVPFYLKKEQPAVSMPFSFLFDELMKGGGVGFSVSRANIRQIPPVTRHVKLDILISKENGDYAAALEAGAQDADTWYKDHDRTACLCYQTPDTREGWVESNALLIDAHFSSMIDHASHVVIDVSAIREKGKKIKGFGGVAAGPVPFIEMLGAVNRVLNQANGKSLTSVDCTDICNLIGKNVVAGNVRRSAEIALGDPDDQAFVTMKQDQEQLMDHRWASNNSVLVTPDFNHYDAVAEAIAKNGEPGIVNLDNIRNYGRFADGRQPGIDADAEGTNPCGEISLGNGEPCNLFEVFPGIAEEMGWSMEEVFSLAVRYAKRVTFSHYDWQCSRTIIEKNRRIGISMSGIQDWVLKRFGERLISGFVDAQDPESGTLYQKPIFNEQAAQRVDAFYQMVVKADQQYSQTLGCSPSIKHTTVKPSGTVSKLVGISEGMHFSFDKYLIQRIRFQDSDPLLPVLQQAGYMIEKDVYSENTMVVEFPVKAGSADHQGFVSANDVSIGEQFATQLFLQTYWADNSVSCTITFHKEEASKIAGLLQQYRTRCKSTSLLPYSGHGFAQAPKEPISKEKYLERKAKIRADVAELYQTLRLKEQKDLEIVGQSDCVGGACPVK